MPIPETLGELVRDCRTRKNLTQDGLARLLNGLEDRPINAFTKKPYAFHRSWVAKLESGSLSRDLSEDVRLFLAKTLGGDATPFLSLPISSPATESERNILPIIIWIASQSNLQTLTFSEFRKLCDADYACAIHGISLSDPLGAVRKPQG